MSEQPLATPEEILARQAYDIRRLRLPAPQRLFAERAARLRDLATGHAMGDYLHFIAQVAQAQHKQLQALPPVALPPADKRAQNREFGMPPLNALTLHRDPVWRVILRDLLAALLALPEGEGGMPGSVRMTLQRFSIQGDEYFEAQASKLLAGVRAGMNVAVAPLIAAALQVYWVALVSQCGEADFPALDVPNVCPCCGTRAVASVSRIGADQGGYRYLHCALCSAEWHQVRAKCTSCDSAAGLHYQSIDDGQAGHRHAVKAECCDRCHSYLKILYLERDPRLEPVADDLASFALDVLVSEAGQTCSGLNYMLVHGEPSTA